MKVITFFRKTNIPLENSIMVEVDATPEKSELVLNAVRKALGCDWVED